jgi:hypothetical protein
MESDMTDRIIKAAFAAGGVAVGTVVTFFVRGRKIKQVTEEGQKIIDAAEENLALEHDKVESLENKLRELRDPSPKKTPNPDQPQPS